MREENLFKTKAANRQLEVSALLFPTGVKKTSLVFSPPVKSKCGSAASSTESLIQKEERIVRSEGAHIDGLVFYEGFPRAKSHEEK